MSQSVSSKYSLSELDAIREDTSKITMWCRKNVTKENFPFVRKYLLANQLYRPDRVLAMLNAAMSGK